jgi:hypothetical protein
MPDNPNRWDKSIGTYLTGQASIDGADATAIECEAYWGCGRLRLLVDENLRAKFDRQRFLYSTAIQTGELADVQREAARMTLAWRTLDIQARATGHRSRPPEVWEVTLPDGTVALLARTVEDLKAIEPGGRRCAAYTLDEIGHLLAGFPALAKAKQTWPGAEVTVVRTRIEDPLNAIDQPGGLDDLFVKGGGDALLG